ncbi:MAG TPA: sugar ABC transporter substrate-binding protein [Conexibacter sp.]|nr:sugar ABC transporter substrate-binding protein [Conexibacter sp.]
MHRKKIIAALVAVVAAIGVAACGSSSDTSSGTNGGSATDSTTTPEGLTAGSGVGSPSAVHTALACESTLTDQQLLDYRVPTANEPYDVTLMMVSLGGYYYQSLVYGAQQAADEAGVKLRVVAGQGFASAPQQVTQVQSVLTRGTDAIVLGPADVNGSVPVVDQADAKGVPTIVVGTLLDSTKPWQIQQDDYLQGKQAADTLARLLPKGGTGIVMGGPSNATWSLRRVAGFQDQLKEKYPDLKISSTTNEMVDPAEGLTKFQNAATKNPQVDWVYSVYNLVLPAASVPAQYKDAIYIGGGFDPQIKEALEDGSADAAILDQAHSMGYMGVGAAVDKLNGRDPQRLVCLPNTPVSAQTVGDPLPALQIYPEDFVAK